MLTDKRAQLPASACGMTKLKSRKIAVSYYYKIAVSPYHKIGVSPYYKIGVSYNYKIGIRCLKLL